MGSKMTSTTLDHNGGKLALVLDCCVGIDGRKKLQGERSQSPAPRRIY